jgi:hypothetical protein
MTQNARSLVVHKSWTLSSSAILIERNLHQSLYDHLRINGFSCSEPLNIILSGTSYHLRNGGIVAIEKGDSLDVEIHVSGDYQSIVDSVNDWMREYGF